MAKNQIKVDLCYKLKNRRFTFENGKLVRVRAIEPENNVAHVSYLHESRAFMVSYSHLEGPHPVSLK